MAKIKLLSVQFVDVKLISETYDPNETNSLSEPTLTVTSLSKLDAPNKFGIRFDIQLSSTTGFSLHVTSIAHFEADEDLDKEFFTSDFVKINGPAIGFPYLRSFISNLTLLSGFNPVFLPTFNFVAMAQNARLKENLNIEDLPKEKKQSTKKNLKN